MIESPEGFLILNSYPGRSGILRYRNADGSSRLELRHPDHVFNRDSLATLAGKPVTVDRHPTEMLTPDNVAKHASGSFANDIEVMGNGLIKIAINLHRRDGIDAVKEKGLRQLSLGYRTDFVHAPGVWNGERYDGLQTNIVYNHGTILRLGRAGAECGLPLPFRLDSADEYPECVKYFDMAIRKDAGFEIPKKNTRSNIAMARLPSGLLPVDLDLDLDPGSAGIISQALMSGKAAQQRLDAAELLATKEKERADSLQSELDLTNGALWALEDTPSSRFDMEEDDDYEHEEMSAGNKKRYKKDMSNKKDMAGRKDMDKKNMFRRKDMDKNDMAGRKDSYSDEEDDRFDADEVMAIAFEIANDITSARNDAMDILSVMQPDEDIVIRMDMNGDEIRAALVSGFYPDLPDDRLDSAEYVVSRFDTLLDTASQLIEMDSSGKNGRQDSAVDYSRDENYGFAPGSHRNDADDLEGLIGASVGGYNNGRNFPLRRGGDSPDKMDPNLRRMQAWQQPGNVSKGELIGVGRQGRY